MAYKNPLPLFIHNVVRLDRSFFLLLSEHSKLLSPFSRLYFGKKGNISADLLAATRRAVTAATAAAAVVNYDLGEGRKEGEGRRERARNSVF